MRILVLMALLIAATASAETRYRWQELGDNPPPAEQDADGEAASGQETVKLEISTTMPAPERSLEVGIVLLDTGIDGDSLENRKLGIFPEIREAESRYLPYALRRTLVDSNQWGAVRVLPGRDPGYELLVSGRILVSNGAELSLQLTVRDSRDYVWLDKTYTQFAEENAYLEAERRLRRPFQDLYNRFANDLLARRRGFEDGDLRRIREVSELRYAAGLLPDAFGDFLGRDGAGLVRLSRLPARDDPMLTRIRRVREQEYIFIDATDEQYAALYTEMSPVYDLWRQFQAEQLAYREAWAARRAQRDTPRKGSYQGMKQHYNNYKWEKIQRQEMRTLAEGFNNQIEPTAMDLDGIVVRLSGSLDQRYREWRDILRRIYALETGA